MPGTEWQWHYIVDDYTEDATNSGTIREKLPVREQISCIEIEVYAEVGTPDFDNSIIDLIDKIEVIADGSKVLYSCIPETAAFLHLAQIKSPPNMLRMDYAGTYDHYRVKICFGRYQRDEEYMLDTGQYNNVYLEIPWELDTDYFTTHTFTYTLRYLRPMERVTPTGFIRSRDIEYGQHAWTSTGEYYVDLPLKYPWYMLGTRIYDKDQDLVDDITHIKLDIDDGRLVLVDDDTDDLITINTERLPYPTHVYHKKGCSGGIDQSIRSYLGRTEEVSIIPYIEDGSVMACLDELVGDVIDYSTVDDGGVACPSGINASLWGTCFMGCLIIKDWYLDWFEPTPHEPFPAPTHDQADIQYSHGAYTVTDLRTFIQEVCPLSI